MTRDHEVNASLPTSIGSINRVRCRGSSCRVDGVFGDVLLHGDIDPGLLLRHALPRCTFNSNTRQVRRIAFPDGPMACESRKARRRRTGLLRLLQQGFPGDTRLERRPRLSNVWVLMVALSACRCSSMDEGCRAALGLVDDGKMFGWGAGGDDVWRMAAAGLRCGWIARRWRRNF